MSGARDPRTELPLPRSCRLYKPGYTVHFIQAKPSREDEESPPISGTVVGFDGGSVIVELQVGVRRYRNHDTGRLAAMIDRFGPTLLVQERWRIMRLEDCGYCFSIALPVDEWHPCRR